MFRRLPGSLPEDPSWEADLTKLGYFINEEGQIRQIRRPTERFQFKISDNDRFNDMHKEAFHKCIRKKIFKRMEKLGAPALYLPQMATIQPDEPSVPIFTTQPEQLKTKSSVIVIINDHMQDLGVWAYRKICTDGFDSGSCTGTIQAIKLLHHSGGAEPGVVIANPGQYYYSHKEGKTLSHESWEALPRKSLFHSTVRLDEKHNLVDGSRDKHEHVATVFEKIVLNDDYVNKDADLYLIGICAGSNTLLNYLNKHWSTFSTRVKAAAWVHPHPDLEGINVELVAFLKDRTRSWVISAAPEGACVGIPSNEPRRAKLDPDAPRSWEDQDNQRDEEEFFCPTFAAGETDFTECVFPSVQKEMLKFFAEVRQGGEGYKNPDFEVVKKPKEEEDGEEGETHGKEFEVKEASRTGGLLAPITAAVEKITEKVKKVVLGEDEVEVAGVAMPKDLLEQAGLD